MLRIPNYRSLLNRKHPLNRGLVSEWVVLPGLVGGNKWFDIAGQNHGILTSGPTWQSKTRSGGFGSLSFAGANDLVSINNADLLNPPSEISISLWFKLVSKTGYRHFVVKQANNTWANPYATYALRINASNQLEAWVNDGGLGGNYATSSTTITDDNWHFAAMTYTQSLSLVIFLDGRMLTSKTISNPLNSSIYPLLLGSQTGGADAFDGYLDNICLYNRYLTPEEILRLYIETKLGNPNRYNYLPYHIFGGGVPPLITRNLLLRNALGKQLILRYDS